MFETIFKEFTKIKWLLVGTVIFFYSLYLKKQIFSAAGEYSLNINIWDPIYSLQNDSYLMVYFLIPIIIFTSVKTITAKFDYTLLIRLKSFNSWMVYTTKEFLVQIFPMFVLLFILSLLMSIGLPFQMNWSEYSTLDNGVNELNELYSKFQNPLVPLFFQFLLWIVASISLHGMLVLLFLMHQKYQYLYIEAALLFLLCVFGFKIFPSEFKFLSPSVYFTIAAGINALSSIWIIFVIPITVFIFEFFVIKYLIEFKKIFRKIKKETIPYIIYTILIFIYILMTFQNNKVDILTLGDLITVVFLGVSAFSSSFASLFAYLIIFFGLSYLSQIRLSHEIGEISHYKIIRYGSIDKWFFRVFIKESLFLFSVLLSIIGFVILFGVFNGLDPSLKTDITSLQNSNLILFIICFSFLQLVCYLLFSFITLWKSSEGYFLLILFGVLSFMLLPGINVWGVFPVGLNAVIVTESFSLQHLVIVLFAYIVGSLMFLKVMFSKSLKI